MSPAADPFNFTMDSTLLGLDEFDEGAVTEASSASSSANSLSRESDDAGGGTITGATSMCLFWQSS